MPVLQRLADGTVTLDDYQRLLFNLRQQVVDGSPWISRAASNFDIDHFELRSAAIRHAEEEHRDYLMLERDYVAIGGSLDELRSGRKNIGSEALSGYMFHYADQPNPVGPARRDVHHRRARREARRRMGRAGSRRCSGSPTTRCTSCSTTRRRTAQHTGDLEAILTSGIIDDAAADEIVRCAQVVARLYALQLEELDR